MYSEKFQQSIAAVEAAREQNIALEPARMTAEEKEAAEEKARLERQKLKNSPEYKKKGIGSMLYQKMMDSMKAEGFQYVSVSTGLDDAHAPARKAYERAGFQKNLPSVRYFQKLQ